MKIFYVAFGGGARRAEGAIILPHHPHHHRAEIRDEPDQPDKDTELVEAQDHFFVFPQQHECGPDGMDKHQDDGQQTRNPVNIVAHAAYEIEHHAGAPGITNETQPEESGMPDFESPLKALAPYADGVKQQG